MFRLLKEGLFSECNFLFKMSWYVSVSVHVLMSIISASPEIRSLHHGVCSIPLPGNTGNKPSHSLKFSNQGEGHYFPCWKRLLLLSYLTLLVRGGLIQPPPTKYGIKSGYLGARTPQTHWLFLNMYEKWYPNVFGVISFQGGPQGTYFFWRPLKKC